MEKPQIAFFLAELTIGGVENVFIIYANELARRGYNVIFVVCRTGGVLEKRLSQRVRIHDLRVNRARKCFFKLRRFIRNYKPDYIITGGDIINVMVIASSLFTKTKVIITEHNYQDIEQQNQGWWSVLQLWLMKRFYPMASKVVGVSEGICNFLIDDLRIKKEKVELLYNPIDLDFMDRKGNEEKEYPVEKPYILFVGRVSPVKNLTLLLSSFEKAETGETFLVIVGDGPSMKEVKEKCNTLKKKEKVIFTGMVDNPLPYIKDTKALVLCSFSEAFPTALLQAMSFNVPVVATPTPGAKEILAYREGTFISKSFNDVEEIACLLEKAINCKSVDLRSHTEKYEINKIIKQLEELIN